MSDYQTDWLDEIDARVKAATPGPWRGVTGSTGVSHWVEVPNTKTIVSDVESRNDAEFIAHAPEDIARLISEVRRYRDEHNPNQAAKYWRTIQTQRQMIKNQAATIEALTEQVTQ